MIDLSRKDAARCLTFPIVTMRPLEEDNLSTKDKTVESIYSPKSVLYSEVPRESTVYIIGQSVERVVVFNIALS